MSSDELRELELEVARKVMEWPDIGADEPFRWYYKFGGVVVSGRAARFPFSGAIPLDWNPASNIADAWHVVEKMRSAKCGPMFELIYGPEPDNNNWLAEFGCLNHPWQGVYEGQGETAPLAICRAALATLTPAPARTEDRR